MSISFGLNLKFSFVFLFPSYSVSVLRMTWEVVVDNETSHFLCALVYVGFPVNVCSGSLFWFLQLESLIAALDITVHNESPFN